MKSILSVFGSFTFFIFSSGFSRLVVSLYHNLNFEITSYAHYPNEYWLLILLLSDSMFIWVSGMLTVTITQFAPGRHLLALGSLLLIWRTNEVLSGGSPYNAWLVLGLTASVLLPLITSYFIHNKMKNTDSTIS